MIINISVSVHRFPAESGIQACLPRAGLPYFVEPLNHRTRERLLIFNYLKIRRIRDEIKHFIKKAVITQVVRFTVQGCRAVFIS